jgi:hypothetical protein
MSSLEYNTKVFGAPYIAVFVYTLLVTASAGSSKYGLVYTHVSKLLVSIIISS